MERERNCAGQTPFPRAARHPIESQPPTRAPSAILPTYPAYPVSHRYNMLLTITTTHQPATDLGYLLRKNPAHAHSRPLAQGTAHVFFPEATLCLAFAIHHIK
jgi:hypothetical protein